MTIDDFTDVLAEVIASRAALAEQIRAAGNRGELASAWPGDDRVAAVTEDPSAPGRWRVTRFDDSGPIGHTEAATLEAAVTEAWAQGFRHWAPGAVEAAMGGRP